MDFEKKVIGGDGNTKRIDVYISDTCPDRTEVSRYSAGQAASRPQRTEEENPNVGILLCKDKNDAMVELTLPKDANIYAAKYELYLPDKKLLQKKPEQWQAEEGDE